MASIRAIVAISSVAGERARRSNFVYGSSKAGFDAFYTGLGEALRAASARSPLAVTVEVDGASHDITLATVLPMAWPAMKRDNGDVFVAIQSLTGSGDASRDLGEVVRAALALPDGQALLGFKRLSLPLADVQPLRRQLG